MREIMYNVCANCGLYRADKVVDRDRSLIICPECQHVHPFHFLPLYLVGGASGTGKTAILEPLLGLNPSTVLLESDILWRSEFDKPEERYRDFFELWLRLAKNVAQNGRPVAIFGAGFVVPENTMHCVEARYFSEIRRLALTCNDELLDKRLRARPAWRDSGTEAFIERQLEFNHWCQERAAIEANIQVLDTSEATVDETATTISSWLSAGGQF